MLTGLLLTASLTTSCASDGLGCSVLHPWHLSEAEKLVVSHEHKITMADQDDYAAKFCQ